MGRIDAYGLGKATRANILEANLKKSSPLYQPVRKALGWRDDTRSLSIQINALDRELSELCKDELPVQDLSELRRAWQEGKLLQTELDEILDKYGEKIWGVSTDERGHYYSSLMLAQAGHDHYSEDLYICQEGHRAYIKLQLEHLTYVKAIRHYSNQKAKTRSRHSVTSASSSMADSDDEFVVPGSTGTQKRTRSSVELQTDSFILNESCGFFWPTSRRKHPRVGLVSPEPEYAWNPVNAKAVVVNDDDDDDDESDIGVRPASSPLPNQSNGVNEAEKTRNNDKETEDDARENARVSGEVVRQATQDPDERLDSLLEEARRSSPMSGAEGATDAVLRDGEASNHGSTQASVSHRNATETSDQEVSSATASTGQGDAQDLLRSSRLELHWLLLAELTNVHHDSLDRSDMQKMWENSNRVNQLLRTIWKADEGRTRQLIGRQQYEEKTRAMEAWTRRRETASLLGTKLNTHPMQDGPAVIPETSDEEWKRILGGEEDYLQFEFDLAYQTWCHEREMGEAEISEHLPVVLGVATKHRSGEIPCKKGLIEFNKKLFAWNLCFLG